MQNNFLNLLIEINYSEIVFLVVENTENSDLKILHKNSVPIKGIESNKISNIEVVLDIFKKNIFSIEQKLNHIFKEAIIITDNFNQSIINLCGYKRLNGSQLLKENITYILNSLKTNINDIESDKIIIHIFNSKYILDNKVIENLPIGLFGNFYSHELSFFLLNNSDYKNIRNILSQCNLKLKKVLSKDFIEGVNLINENSNLSTFFKVEIREKKSRIIFFENSSLIFSQEFDFGSDLIIRDISKVIGLKIENVKDILTSLSFEKEKIKNEYLEEKFFFNHNFKKIKKKLILDISRARIQEFSEIMLIRNVNLLNHLKKNIQIFLKINDELNMKCLLNFFKQYFSYTDKFNTSILDNRMLETLYKNAFKVVQYGWKKEAVPIVNENKSIIARFFEKLFK